METGVVPDKIVAIGTAVGDTSKALMRPLCPYPKIAQYKGPAIRIVRRASLVRRRRLHKRRFIFIAVVWRGARPRTYRKFD